MEPIVVGLLGITHPHASARVRALREIDGVEVVAAADDDSRLNYFTDKYDMEARSVEAVLQDERINAIMVHSKSKDMVAHALRALEAGKSVVVEKPGGGTVEDLERLAEAEAQAGPGQVVQVGYNVRLAQSITRAKELIEAGVIGEVVTVAARGAALVGEHRTAHLNQPADMGGVLWILGCHMLDSLVHMFGAPESVNARVHKSARLSDETSREDSAAVLLNYPDMSMTFMQKIYESRHLIPAVILIGLVLGGIYSGIATATEAAALGVAGALGLAAWEGSLSWQKFKEGLISACRVYCMIGLILAGAAFLTLAMGFIGLPRHLAEWIGSLHLSPFALLMMLTVFFIVLGCFLDGISMVVLTIAVLLPTVEAAGYDLIWFGIFIVLVVEMAQITPPVGLNLFVIQGLTKRDIGWIARAAAPMFFVLMAAVLMLYAVPEIVLWLPSRM